MYLYKWKTTCCSTEAVAFRDLKDKNIPPKGGCFCGKNKWVKKVDGL